MSDPLPPILSYHAPTKFEPNFGTRAAKASWLIPLAAVLLFATASKLHLLGFGRVIRLGSVLLWVVGFVSSVAALASIRQYGSARILRPAVVGLCLNLVFLLLIVAVVVAMCLGAV